jgi:RNA polymerase sigma-70 factor, ECF subfamily
MISASRNITEPGLLEAACGGDEEAFSLLIEPHYAALNAHCYRMLGSPDDAEDALQDALLRAWRGLRGCRAERTLRPWLFRIATNACLDAIARRPKRMLAIDFGSSADSDARWPGTALPDSARIEPRSGLLDGFAAPEARYEQRESVELAFIAVLRHLPPRQRAVLILREVLGFSATEVAASLGTTVASVNSALQRARKAADERAPEQSRLATMRSPGDEQVRELGARFADALERGDVEAIVALLAQDATFARPHAWCHRRPRPFRPRRPDHAAGVRRRRGRAPHGGDDH